MSVGSRPLPVAPPRRAGRKRAREAEASDATTNKGSVTRRPRCCPCPASPSAGPRAAVALSDWLGNDALLSTRAAASAESVGLLGQLLAAGAALPRHVALLAAALTSAHNQQEDTTDGADLVRLAAVKGLGALEPSLVRPHLPLLVDRMGQDPSDRVQAAALAAATGGYNARVAPLAGTYTPEVITALADGSSRVRRAAMGAIVGRLASHVGPKDVGAIARLLRARAVPTREAALGALDGLLASTITTTATTIEALRALHGTVATLASKDPAPTIRVLALAFLGRLPPTLTLPHLGAALLPRLGDGHAEVQAAAVVALERLRDHQDTASPLSDALRRHAQLLVELFTRPPGGRLLALGGGAERARRTRTVVLQVLSSSVPAAALEPFVGELAEAVGWERAAGAGGQEEEEDQQEKEKGKQQSRRALAPMPVGSPPSSSSSSPSRGRGSGGSSSSPRVSSSPSSSPRPRRLVFEDEAEAEDGEDEEARTEISDTNEKQAIQEGMLALLGQVPTQLLLPHTPAVARRLLLPTLLADPRAPDATVVAAVTALLTSIKNPELRAQCLSHLLVLGLDCGTTSGQYARRRRVLRLLLTRHLEASLPPLLPQEADALAACLTDSALHVRRDASLLLLRGVRSSVDTKQKRQPWRAALVAFLRREGDLGWLVKAVEGDEALRGAVVAVVEGEEEGEEEEGQENACQGGNVRIDDLRQLLIGEEGKGAKTTGRPSLQGQGGEKLKQD